MRGTLAHQKKGVSEMAELCSYDEAYDIYDAEEIGWCAKCKCDKNCPMYNKLHTRTQKKEVGRSE